MASSHPFQNLIVTYAPGERIFTEGEVGGTMFIVHSGRARLFRETNGRTVEIAEMEKGDFFGEMSLLEGTARNLSAEAIDPIELIEINSTTFDRMIRGNIEIAVRLLRKLSGRLQKMEQQVSALQESVARAAAAPPAIPAESAAPQSAPAPAPRPAPAPGTKLARSAPSGRATAEAPPKSPTPKPAVHEPVHVNAPSGAPAQMAVAASATVSAPTSVPTPSAPAPRPAIPAPASARSAAARDAGPAGPRLVCEAGDTVFLLRTSESTIGRYDPVTETQPEVDLTLVDTKRSVSRRHAKIALRGGSYLLTEEVGALNGTFLNGSKLVTGKPAELKNGDQISLGTVHLVFKA